MLRQLELAWQQSSNHYYPPIPPFLPPVMQQRGLYWFVTIVFTALCIYYLSFTFVANNVEDDARSFATDTKTGEVDLRKKQAYLDSMWTEPVLDLGIMSFTYKDAKNQEIKLGLDLKGGMFVTMEVSGADILRVLANNNPNPAFQQALKAAQASSVEVSNSDFVALFYKEFKAVSNGTTLASIFSNRTNDRIINLSSKDEEVLKYLNDEVNGTLDRTFEILRARIDKFGVTQPNIQRLQGTSRIQIELPGVESPERVRKLLQGIAKLEFYETFTVQEFIPFYQKLNDYMVLQERSGNKLVKEDEVAAAKPDSATLAGALPTTSDSATAKTDSDSKTADVSKPADTAKKDTAVSKTLRRLISIDPYGRGIFALVKDTANINRILSLPDVQKFKPSNMRILWQSKPDDNGGNGKPFLMMYAPKTTREGNAQLGGEEVASAYRDIDERGRNSVNMSMKPEGARIWRNLTRANVGKSIAIVLDNRVQSAPTVQGEIPNGSSSISGNFTIEEASDLENILKAGKMPVPIRIVEESVVGPTLGAESIQQGLISILVGFLVIILFMVAYYSTSGFVADIAVLINIVFILGALVQFNAVLTLPGIAGIVLTIGMAVDANVLINERIKEELREGVPLALAIDNGYKMASSSIWDANITTLIAGAVLVYFGSGPVQGFASTLILGIITSLFTSIYVTRLLNERRLSKGQSIGFWTSLSKDAFKNVNFDFVGKRKIAYIASSILIFGGLALIAVRGLNYGVDFSGGWSYIVQFDKDVTTDQVRDALSGNLQSSPEVKAFGEASRVKITTNYLITDQSEDAAIKVETAVKAGLDKVGAKYEIKSSAKVGPTVAQDIRSKSLIAVIIALIGIFGYIWIRFRRWEYALGATIAIFHDALVVIVLYSIGKDLLPFTLEIDQNFIAAVLTIVGYSVNDTVVIFDRIREMIKEEGEDVDRADLLNRALNNTFSRTVVTASTVFLVVLILLVFGGETVRGMSFALLVGVLSGTYSTIYIAVPFVLDAWKKNKIS